MPTACRHLLPRACGIVLSAGLVLGSTACTSESGSVEEFCEAIANVPPLASVVTGFAETHPAEVSSRLDDAEAAYADLREAAPGEIDDEVDRVVDLVEEITAAVRDNAEDRDAAADRVRDSIADHPEAADASAAVVAFASEHCGIELDPTPDDEPTATEPPDQAPDPAEPSQDGPDDSTPDGSVPDGDDLDSTDFDDTSPG